MKRVSAMTAAFLCSTRAAARSAPGEVPVPEGAAVSPQQVLDVGHRIDFSGIVFGFFQEQIDFWHQHHDLVAPVAEHLPLPGHQGWLCSQTNCRRGSSKSLPTPSQWKGGLSRCAFLIRTARWSCALRVPVTTAASPQLHRNGGGRMGSEEPEGTPAPSSRGTAVGGGPVLSEDRIRS